MKVALLVSSGIVVLAASVASIEGQTTATVRPPNIGSTSPLPDSPSVPPSTEIHADGTVTFRLSAKGANAVSVTIGGAVHPMTKGNDGVWTAVVGPFVPEIYVYTFNVDELTRILDVQNSWVKPVTAGAPSGSILEIRANPPRFDQVQDVPHGSLEVLTYTSTPYRRERNLYVYVPPQYVTGGRRFPVLYLRHGNTDTEASWSSLGRAGIILENLIAERRAEPMLIVMPFGESNASGGNSPEGLASLEREMSEDIIPLVEKRYRVIADREHRAVAGLSMGGAQALVMGLTHLERYGWVGEFSSGLGIQTYLPSVFKDLTSAKEQLHLLFISCGTEDPRYPGHLDLVDDFKSQGLQPVWYSTPGGHEWKVWRHSLHEFLPRLFKSRQ